jgi:hypothetical protein
LKIESERLRQIALVIQEIKREVYSRAILEEDISDNSFREIFDLACHRVATHLGITLWSVSSKITTQLDLTKDEAIEYTKEFITNKNPISTRLGQTVMWNLTEFDNPANVKSKLNII